MGVAIEEVKQWLTLRGVGHAVAELNRGWSYTACGSIVSCDPDSTIPPKRICKRCREALKRCELLEAAINQATAGRE